jgi:hypothetical protein
MVQAPSEDVPIGAQWRRSAISGLGGPTVPAVGEIKFHSPPTLV